MADRWTQQVKARRAFGFHFFSALATPPLTRMVFAAPAVEFGAAFAQVCVRKSFGLPSWTTVADADEHQGIILILCLLLTENAADNTNFVIRNWPASYTIAKEQLFSSIRHCRTRGRLGEAV